MKRNQVVMMSVAIVALVLAGAVAFLILSGKGANATNDNQAQQQFLTERNGGTPVPNEQLFIGGPDGSTETPIVGTVASVSNDSVTVKRDDGSQVTVKLAAGGSASSQESITIADIKVGESVSALGDDKDGVYTAQSLMAGVSANDSAPGPIVTRRDVPSGGGPAGGNVGPATQGQLFHPLAGTVTKVDEGSVTIKGSDGKETKVMLASDAQLSRQVNITLADLHSGDQILASGGKLDGDTYTAQNVQKLPH